MLSLHWQGAVVPRDAQGDVEQLHDVRRPVLERKAALIHLLNSDSVVARGIALDFYSIVNANMRQGNQAINQVIADDEVDAAVRRCALHELTSPPYDGPEGSSERIRGANHMSALHSLWFNAHPSDASILARILTDSDIENVLREGVSVAEPILRGDPARSAPAHPTLLEALLRTVHRSDIDPEIRALAITAIGGATDESIEQSLVDVLAHPELAISAAGARALLERDIDRYRPLVEPVVAAWPAREFPPFDVLEVHRLLEDD